MNIVWLTGIAFGSLVIIMLVEGLCRAAAKHTPKPTGIGRRSYAEGRPTMPSEVEPHSETERRTR
jgi:hypothetical protein